MFVSEIIFKKKKLVCLFYSRNGLSTRQGLLFWVNTPGFERLLCLIKSGKPRNRRVPLEPTDGLGEAPHLTLGEASPVFLSLCFASLLFSFRTGLNTWFCLQCVFSHAAYEMELNINFPRSLVLKLFYDIYFSLNSFIVSVHIMLLVLYCGFC